MTDTITLPIVEHTITALTSTLERAQQRLIDEEREYAEKRDAMVATAHRLGTNNGIGEALDDLLEEFDLPRRPRRINTRMLLMVSAPLPTSGGESITTADSTYVYRGRGQRLSWPVGFEYQINHSGGDVCTCEDPRGIADALRGWFGDSQSANMTFQIGRVECDGGDCTSDSFYPDASSSQVDEIDWATLPVHPVVLPAT